MGTLTLDNIKDEIREHFAGRTDLDARLERVINLSQMRIARRKRWEELEQSLTVDVVITGSIDDDRFFGMPPNTRDIYSLIAVEDGARWKKLRRVDQRLFDKQVTAADEYDRRMPEIYIRWQNMIEMFPVPDIAYQLRARICKWPTPLTSSSQTSDLAEKDDMLIMLSVAYLYNSLKKLEEAGRFWRIYVDMLQAAIDEEGEHPDLDMLPRAGVGQSGQVTEYHKDPFVSRMP